MFMPTTTEKAEAVGSIAVICGMVTGFASLVGAIFSFFSYNWIGVGVCLGSAGLAFGLIANAVWRH
jgi:hypothetical protein